MPKQPEGRAEKTDQPKDSIYESKHTKKRAPVHSQKKQNETRYFADSIQLSSLTRN